METYTVLFKEGETTGVFGISLVENPAMESMFIALSKEEIVELKAIDTEKRIVCGAVLIPNKPILRSNNGSEFNIVFPEETIRLASEGFLKNGHQSSSTLEHDIDTRLSGVTIVESWIKANEVNDKSVVYGFTEPVGTWYASMKIDNDEIWNDFVKTGKVKGFSIDGFFDLEKINLKSEIKMSEQKSIIEVIGNAIKEGFASISLKKEEVKIELGSVNTADGTVEINFEGDTVAKDLQVTMTAPDGMELPLPDGSYELEGGMSVTVVGSIITDVATTKEASEEVAPAVPLPMSDAQPSIKSEKVTSEVFYQLSNEDKEYVTSLVSDSVKELGIELAKQFSTVFGQELENTKVELKKQFLGKEVEIISLTKTKPASNVEHPNKSLADWRAGKVN